MQPYVPIPGLRAGERIAEVRGIQGVVAANAQWELVWADFETADGIIPTADGGVMFAQEQTDTIRKEGAMAGMLAGLFFTLFYVFAHKGLFFIKGTEYLGLIGGANSFFGITPEAIGAVGAMVNFAVAFLVDKVTAPPPAHIQSMVEAVRIPRGSKLVNGAH